METVLSWIGLVVGAAVAAFGTLAGGRDEGDDDQSSPVLPVALASLAVVAVAFLLTLPQTPPFSLGGRLGWGILVGGVVGTAAAWLAYRCRSAFAVVVAPSAALFAVSLLLVLFADYPQAALGGFWVGAVIPAVVFGLALEGFDALWALSSLVLGSTVLLATLRYDTVDGRLWWRAPLLVLASVVIGYVAGTALSRGREWVVSLVTAVVTVGLAAVFAWKVFPDWSLLFVVVLGVLTYALVAWISSVRIEGGQAPAVVALLVVALAALAFRSMAGFGVGLAALVSFAVLIPLVRSGERAMVVASAVWIGLGVALVRLFMEGFADELRGIDLRAYYTLVALVVGAVFPLVVSSMFPMPELRARVWRVPSACAAGAFAALAPLVVMVVWGPRAVLGFLVGTIAANVFLLFSEVGAVEVRRVRESHYQVLTAVAQVSAVVFSGLVLPVYDEPRATKIAVFGAVIVLGFAWAAVSWAVSRKSGEA